MIQIVVDKGFEGSDIIDHQHDLRNIEGDTIDLRWQNTKPEIALLNKFSDLNFRLHVPDISTQERTATTFGLPMEFDRNTINAAYLALNTRKSYDWRNFVEGRSHIAARNILIRLAADALRSGKRSSLALIVDNFAKKSAINPADADILLRLKVLKG
jgi:hypothetical protein